jgi:Uncharacterized alpha/beta hydrolase domain (DUF2235)
MNRKIILLSDGTGNSSAKIWRTNVWRIFEAIDLSASEQVAFYDDGVGTSALCARRTIGEPPLGEHVSRRFLDGRDLVAVFAEDRADLLGIINAIILGATVGSRGQVQRMGQRRCLVIGAQ